MQQIVCATSKLPEYALGLRPRPNTPGTHRVWKTCAPPRLVRPRFRQKRRADWPCVSPNLSPANFLSTRSRPAASATYYLRPIGSADYPHLCF